MKFTPSLPCALLALVPATFAASGKRGLTWPWYNENSSLDPGRLRGSATYIYNWETWRPGNTGGLNFIGMQGCYPSCSSSPVDQLATRASQQGWSIVFSANEPDLQGRNPAEVASWYRQYIEPLRMQKAYPAVTSSNDPGKGLDWLAQFMNSCQGCYHDFINLHWYGPNYDSFRSFIETAHRRFPNERIVISEYALINPASANHQNDFFQRAIPWLESLSYVSMHFPFIGTSRGLLAANDGGASSYVGFGSCLYNDNGSLSIVGNTFNS